MPEDKPKTCTVPACIAACYSAAYSLVQQLRTHKDAGIHCMGVINSDKFRCTLTNVALGSPLRSVQHADGIDPEIMWIQPPHAVAYSFCLQAEGIQADFRRQLAEVGVLHQTALAKGHRQEAALQQARQETLEAVQQGNQKYATMLAERMGIEDELRHQLASKQQAAAARSAANCM